MALIESGTDDGVAASADASLAGVVPSAAVAVVARRTVGLGQVRTTAGALIAHARFVALVKGHAGHRGTDALATRIADAVGGAGDAGVAAPAGVVSHATDAGVAGGDLAAAARPWAVGRARAGAAAAAGAVGRAAEAGGAFAIGTAYLPRPAPSGCGCLVRQAKPERGGGERQAGAERATARLSRCKRTRQRVEVATIHCLVPSRAGRAFSSARFK